MSKQTKGKNSQATSPCKEISLETIAKLFNLKRHLLYFGIAETMLEEDCFDYLPVVLIHDTDLHISLVSGIPISNTQVLGFIQNFIKADVKYNEKDECFDFIVKDRVLAKLRENSLCQIFGEDIVKF